MTSYRRGLRGARPIVGRRVQASSIVCRKCRRFCGASLALTPEAARAKAAEQGWTELAGEDGTCPACASPSTPEAGTGPGA